MRKRIVCSFAIAITITLTILGSSALVAAPALATETTLPPQNSPSLETTPLTESTPEDDYSAFDYARYRFEGIPQPWWDASVDGWIKYLGDGHFISEYGVEFFWRDGRFVYANGTVMGLPASAKAHLNSLGVYRQLTAEDLTGREDTLSKFTDDEAQVEGGFAAAAWPGTYLHVGRNTTTSTAFYATQADISVYNRSPGYQQYQGIGLRHAGDYRLGFQYCAQSPANEAICWWVPAVHGWIDGDPVEWPYAQKTISTTPTHAETHNLKLAVKANGYIYPYVDHGLSVDPDHIAWDTSNKGAAQSAFELGSDSKYEAPHDPANHHSNIKVQTSINGTWYTLTNSVSPVTMYNHILQGDDIVADGLYNYLWYINPNYNWMAHPL